MAKNKKEVAALPSSPSDDKWQAESDFRTLVDAEKIKNDEKRFKAAMKHAKEQKKIIRSVEDLKEARNEAWAPESED